MFPEEPPALSRNKDVHDVYPDRVACCVSMSKTQLVAFVNDWRRRNLTASALDPFQALPVNWRIGAVMLDDVAVADLNSRFCRSKMSEPVTVELATAPNAPALLN